MTKERARLQFNDEPGEIPPAIPAEKIKEATRLAGFHETPRRSGEVDVEEPRRRTRRKTGRVHQFATRLRESTVDDIHAYADKHELTLAEVIERAMAALANRDGQ